ncbi:MAG: DUF4180 domain-containing protein [Anaerolineales bacterium]|nr:DUF4180 domain-containing protein [Anaerolineales bacterium]
MHLETIHTAKGDLSYYRPDGDVIATPAEFLDLMANCSTDTIVLDKAALHADFFALRTGLAGEILLKLSNYRMRLIVLGDYENIESRSLRDFIYESNRTGNVLFTKTIEDAVRLLR